MITIIEDIAKQQRDILLDSQSLKPLFRCVESSYRLQEALTEKKITTTLIKGYVKVDRDVTGGGMGAWNGSLNKEFFEKKLLKRHCWLKTEDGYIVDITGDQFTPEIDPESQYQIPPVYISQHHPRYIELIEDYK
jgi:hypothetical protein